MNVVPVALSTQVMDYLCSELYIFFPGILSGTYFSGGDADRA